MTQHVRKFAGVLLSTTFLMLGSTDALAGVPVSIIQSIPTMSEAMLVVLALLVLVLAFRALRARSGDQ